MAESIRIPALPAASSAADSDLLVIESGNVTKKITKAALLSGIVGTPGPQGPKGDKGDKGDTGDSGPAGPQGLQGVPGSAGSPGPAGADGAPGVPGPAGADGAPGQDGAQGPQGPAGSDGAQGPQGEVGPQGPKGDRGDVGPAGADGAPGVDGAQGPQGNPGPQGEIGPQGVKGDKGDPGDQGPQGPEGPAGPEGPEGPQGPQGEQGPAGTADVSAAWPVGSVFISVVHTDPATLLGFGTWQAFAAGRMLVGFNASDADFDTLEETGGAKTHTLTEAEMPSHAHPVTDPGHSHVEQNNSATTGGLAGWGARDTSTNTAVATGYSTQASQTGMTVDAAGGGQAHNNLPPYLTVRMWKRTA